MTEKAHIPEINAETMRRIMGNLAKATQEAGRTFAALTRGMQLRETLGLALHADVDRLDAAVAALPEEALTELSHAASRLVGAVQRVEAGRRP